MSGESKKYKFSEWIILNKYGSPWTTDSFWLEEDAEKHLDTFWGEGKYNPKDFKIVQADITFEWSKP